MAQAKRVAKPKPDEPTLVAGGARRTIMLALWLTSFIPLMMVGYSFYAYVLPLLDHTRQVRDLPWLQELLVFTGLLMAVGGLLIWDLTRALPRLLGRPSRGDPWGRVTCVVACSRGRGSPGCAPSPACPRRSAAGGSPRPLRRAPPSAYQELESTTPGSKVLVQDG